ncbi:SIMPL domain-containing protein [Nocardioides sp.]|uniref:SIMPL domain-containing protein n=1 Tax=Nocardioides sp. TaxID=35761 RepID=UPI003527A685
MKRTVTTTGRGTVQVVPDAAVVTIGARHQASGVAEACAGVDSAARSIGEVARRHTDEARISSTGLTVWPAHDRSGQPSGFEARHSLRIRVADVTAAGRLLAELAEEVGDRLTIDGVSLTVSDPGPAAEAAREAAYADARERAEALAALSDASLGEVVTVVEDEPGFARPVALAAGRAAKADLAFEAGEQGVSATVRITWRLV